MRVWRYGAEENERMNESENEGKNYEQDEVLQP